MSAPHVVPIADLVEHEVGPDCVCGPDLSASDEGDVWINHSLDNREVQERKGSDQ